MAAGEIALGYFKSKNEVWLKPGNSPVSQADIKVNDFLRQHLANARPGYGWLSEETAASDQSVAAEMVFVVDPIDGTRGFLEGSAHWSVCIAVMASGTPVAGVVHCPASRRTFAAALGQGATHNGSPLRTPHSERIERLAGSRRINEELDRAAISGVSVPAYVPSLACRIAYVAAGEIDAVLARGGSQIWDIAAPQIILEQAGGSLCTRDGSRLRHDLHKTGNPAFVAAGAGRIDGALRLAKLHGFLH